MSISKILISYFLLTPIFLSGSFFINNNFTFANNALDHLVISEIQIGGENVNDEFIELYNPTDDAINLDGWDLKRKTGSGSENNILNNIEGIIPSRGYFLIIPRANCGDDKNEKCYQGETAGDDEYTTNSFLAVNNTVLLYDDNGNLIDKVGWGEASDFEGEAINANLENGKSLERIIVDSLMQDTNNNNDDFILSANPNPQNSLEHIPDFPQEENNDNNNDDDNNSDDDGQDDGLDQEDGDNMDGGDSNDNDNDDDDEIPPAPFCKGGVNVIITEFLPNPEDSDRDNEFIEIYNAGETEINLGGWTLEDKIGKTKSFEIGERIKIKAGDYKIFYSDETRIVLNNSGDGVVLKDEKGNIKDETPVSDSAKEDQSYALDKNKDWVWTPRFTPGRENIIIKEDDEYTPDPSQEGNNDDDDKHIPENPPNPLSQRGNSQEGNSNNEISSDPPAEEENNKIIKYNFSDEIIISEIYPNPIGRDNRDGNYEWIELYNCSAEDVDLIGWQIDDILKKGSKSYLIKENKIIKAKSYLVLTNKKTKVIFNNSGDEVNLLWPDGIVIDSAQYEKSIEGQSYNWTKNGWYWSQTITPNRNNITEISSFEYNFEQGSVRGVENTEDKINENEYNEYLEIDYIETDLRDLKHFTKHSRVKISGIVSTPPKIFADNVFYLAGSGIQVFSYGAKIPKIELGDEIELIGRVSEVGGERRILLDDAKDLKIISRDNLIEAKLISTGDINEAVEGYLAMVEGKVSQIKSDTFFLDDGSGEIKIYLKPQTGIKKPKIKIGDWMVITGQVSRTSAGYRILPRFRGDIRLSRISGTSIAKASSGISGAEETESKVGNNRNSLWSNLFFVIIILILIYWGKMKIKRKKVSQFKS